MSIQSATHTCNPHMHGLNSRRTKHGMQTDKKFALNLNNVCSMISGNRCLNQALPNVVPYFYQDASPSTTPTKSKHHDDDETPAKDTYRYIDLCCNESTFGCTPWPLHIESRKLHPAHCTPHHKSQTLHTRHDTLCFKP